MKLKHDINAFKSKIRKSYTRILWYVIFILNNLLFRIFEPCYVKWNLWMCVVIWRLHFCVENKLVSELKGSSLITNPLQSFLVLNVTHHPSLSCSIIFVILYFLFKGDKYCIYSNLHTGRLENSSEGMVEGWGCFKGYKDIKQSV